MGYDFLFIEFVKLKILSSEVNLIIELKLLSEDFKILNFWGFLSFLSFLMPKR